MHQSPGPAPAFHEPDDPLDGRDTLRLVRIRLILTLLAVGIVPAALVAPIVRTLADETRVEQRAILSTDARYAAADLRDELGAISLVLAESAANGPLRAAVAGDESEKTLESVTATLAAIIGRPSDAVVAVALADSTGRRVVSAGPGAWPASAEPAIDAGTGISGHSTFRLVLVPDDDAVLVATIGVPVEDGEPGALLARIDLGRLLEWATPDASITNRVLELRDADGQRLAAAGDAFDAMGLPGTVLDLATDASRGTAGVATVEAPGLETWQLTVSAPLPVSELSSVAVTALVAVVVVLVVLVWWMGRSILRPAARLEASRDRLRELYETAREAALRDSLTGLGNHRAFQEAVIRLVDASRRYGTPFGLILFDVDEFKRINDTRGHAVGDELLATIGELIRTTTRQADAGYRIGGDEFAILLNHTDLAGSEILARRLLSRALEDRPTGAYRGAISFSAGVTACPDLATDRAALTAQADAALYRSKRGGRTLVSVYDPAVDRGHVDEGRRAELSAAVSAVVESNGLSPVYQPIVHLESGRVLGYEGLVRVRPESGFPHAGALFDAAEIAGRVLDLDRAALDTVLRGAAAVREPTLLSLNVSPSSFEAPEFNAAVFLAILRRHGVPPERVILELTEREAVRDADRLRTAVVTLQKAGVRVAADDVGAGNAGLRLLSQFRFDVVKIDLSLVQGGAGEDQTLSVLTSLVGLASRWGALTIAEGVETPAELRMIRELGVGAAQGYLLGRPGPETDLEWLDLDAIAARDGVVTPAARPIRPGAPTPAAQVAIGSRPTQPWS